MHGYLVVLAESKSREYKGVNRIPPYPAECPDEAAATEAYALGDFKSLETNLIDTHERAFALLRMYARSQRQFEVIRCDTKDLEIAESGCAATCYGYDVAAIPADYWSIVDDIDQSPWAASYRSALNEYGLFQDRAMADNYLRDYRANSSADADAPFIVVRVDHVPLSAARPVQK
jgi:hypothetical protein